MGIIYRIQGSHLTCTKTYMFGNGIKNSSWPCLIYFLVFLTDGLFQNSKWGKTEISITSLYPVKPRQPKFHGTPGDRPRQVVSHHLCLGPNGVSTPLSPTWNVTLSRWRHPSTRPDPHSSTEEERVNFMSLPQDYKTPSTRIVVGGRRLPSRDLWGTHSPGFVLRDFPRSPLEPSLVYVDKRDFTKMEICPWPLEPTDLSSQPPFSSLYMVSNETDRHTTPEEVPGVLDLTRWVWNHRNF